MPDPRGTLGGGPEYFDEIDVDPVSAHIGGLGGSRGSAKSGVKIFRL